MQKGIKISFEGIDGSGKTTQSELLSEALKDRGYKVYRCPDNSDVYETDDLGGRILGILREEKDRFFRIGYSASEAMLLAARASYIDIVDIVPRINSGYVVIADRDIDTFVSYGMPSLRKEFPDKSPQELMDWLISLISVGRTQPDITLFFAPDIAEFTSRATAGIHDEDGKDIFTLDDIGFLEETVIHYAELQLRFPQRICMLEVAKKSKERVLLEVLDIILPLLRAKNVPVEP